MLIYFVNDSKGTIDEVNHYFHQNAAFNFKLPIV